jgi:ribonuclease P protein component
MAMTPPFVHGPATCRLITLTRRSQFLRLRKGARWATPAFVLEAKERSEACAVSTPRFGFTVTKQVGKAVERNRIKRRLKAAVRNAQMEHARCEFDYVVIARRPALQVNFRVLCADLVKAFARVHRPRGQQASSPGSAAQGSSGNRTA